MMPPADRIYDPGQGAKKDDCNRRYKMDQKSTSPIIIDITSLRIEKLGQGAR